MQTKWNWEQRSGPEQLLVETVLAKITAVPREPQVEGSSATVTVEISGVDMRAVTGSLGSGNPKESKDVQQILPALLRLLERENVPMARTLVEHQLVK